jgi:hypothetical protein
VSRSGAGVASPLADGPVAVGDDAVQVRGYRGGGGEDGEHPGEEAVENLAGAGPRPGDRDITADRPGCLRGEAGAQCVSIAALQGGDVPGDNVACFLSTTPARRTVRLPELALIGASPPSWTAFYPAKARTLARAAPRGVAFRRIAAPRITITTSLVIRDDSPDARAFLQAFRTCAD